MLVIMFAIIVAVIILMPSIRRRKEAKARADFAEKAAAANAKAKVQIKKNDKIWKKRDSVLADVTLNPFAILEILL